MSHVHKNVIRLTFGVCCHFFSVMFVFYLKKLSMENENEQMFFFLEKYQISLYEKWTMLYYIFFPSHLIK